MRLDCRDLRGRVQLGESQKSRGHLNCTLNDASLALLRCLFRLVQDLSLWPQQEGPLGEGTWRLGKLVCSSIHSSLLRTRRHASCRE